MFREEGLGTRTGTPDLSDGHLYGHRVSRGNVDPCERRVSEVRGTQGTNLPVDSNKTLGASLEHLAVEGPESPTQREDLNEELEIDEEPSDWGVSSDNCIRRKCECGSASEE